MKKYLIIGICLIIVSVSLVIYNEIKNKPVNIYSLTNTASKKENVNVYLNASFIAGSIKHNNQNYYVIFGDSVQYLVLIDDHKASEINKYLLDNPTNTKRIEGITKLIPRDIVGNGIKFIDNYLDSMHNHNEEHVHNITEDDFNQYFGFVYLDTNVSMNIIIIIAILSGIMGTLLTINYLNRKFNLL